jgi:hypothetical protein
MEFRIADNFTAALGKLTRDEQKAVKTSVFDLQTNPEHPGLSHLTQQLQHEVMVPAGSFQLCSQ